MAEAWDEVHKCAQPGTRGNAVHIGDPLTVKEILELTDGTEVVVTWDGGNGPHQYTVRIRHPDRPEVGEDPRYTTSLLIFGREQRIPIHRITRVP